MSKNSDTIDSSIDTEDVISDQENLCDFNDLVDMEEKISPKELKGDDRITKNQLTRYEFVRVIGERTKQLSMGAKPLIKISKDSEDLEYNELALEELKYNMIPFKIKRNLINSYEIWSLDELSKDHLLSFFN